MTVWFDARSDRLLIGPVIDLYLPKQYNRHAEPLTLRDLGAQFNEQRFDAFPSDVGRNGAGKDQLEGFGGGAQAHGDR